MQEAGPMFESTAEIRCVGLDVHKETIAVAVAEADGGKPWSYGEIANDPAQVRKLVRALRGEGRELRMAYEAGPTGYGLQRQLSKLGADCVVVAPSRIPRSVSERKRKNDRRDAELLARLLRSGDLVPIWIPAPEHEAFRDLVRARFSAKQDVRRHDHQLTKALLRWGLHPPRGLKKNSAAYRSWCGKLKVEQRAAQIVLDDLRETLTAAKERLAYLEGELHKAVQGHPQLELMLALQLLSGIGELTAATVVAEVGDFRRFATASSFMNYSGLTPSEHSSGEHQAHGPITKEGNGNLRHVLVQGAHNARHQPRSRARLKQTHGDLPSDLLEIVARGESRCHQRYHYLSHRVGSYKAVVAVARERAGFIWAIGQRMAERELAA
jgi:transposase